MTAARAVRAKLRLAPGGRQHLQPGPPAASGRNLRLARPQGSLDQRVDRSRTRRRRTAVEMFALTLPHRLWFAAATSRSRRSTCDDRRSRLARMGPALAVSRSKQSCEDVRRASTGRDAWARARASKSLAWAAAKRTSLPRRATPELFPTPPAPRPATFQQKRRGRAPALQCPFHAALHTSGSHPACRYGQREPRYRSGAAAAAAKTAGLAAPTLARPHSQQ